MTTAQAGFWLWLALAGGGAALWWRIAWGTERLVRSLPMLGEGVAEDARPAGRVSLLCPARDEAEAIAATIQTWLAQDHADIEVIAIDDRSVDATGAILQGLAEEDPRLVPMRITGLPAGWLGKSHALQRGVARASGDWLLFCDADVQLSRDTVRLALAQAEAGGWDLLTVFPTVTPGGWVLEAFWTCVGMIMGPGGRPWEMPDPTSEVALGAGAFILIRRAAWDATPGMPWLALEVADDMALGQLIKRHGGRCCAVGSGGRVRLPWYASPRDAVLKMQKNWFGIVGRFSVARTLGVGAAVAGLALYPLWMLPPLVLPGWSAAWALVPSAGVAAAVLAGARAAVWNRRSPWPSLWQWAGWGLIALMCGWAAVIGARVGGIVWRGQVYRSEDLAPHQRVRF